VSQDLWHTPHSNLAGGHAEAAAWLAPEGPGTSVGTSVASPVPTLNSTLAGLSSPGLGERHLCSGLSSLGLSERSLWPSLEFQDLELEVEALLALVPRAGSLAERVLDRRAGSLAERALDLRRSGSPRALDGAASHGEAKGPLPLRLFLGARWIGDLSFDLALCLPVLWAGDLPEDLDLRRSLLLLKPATCTPDEAAAPPEPRCSDRRARLVRSGGRPRGGVDIATVGGSSAPSWAGEHGGVREQVGRSRSLHQKWLRTCSLPARRRRR